MAHLANSMGEQMGRQAEGINGRTERRVRTFLGRLASDVRGNTLAIMAAALIPLAGMVGGGIDMSRMYLTKTRLQHACDAGALAGRKNMGGGNWGADDQVVADQFFTANFGTGSYGSTNLTHAFSEAGGKVSGTASAILPMTLMRVLGFTTQTLTVACDAEMRLPNTDVMFVLDTTGSMADTPSGDSQSKLSSLKIAVKCFYEIVAHLDTDANCTTGTPSGGTGSQVQVRFGFMPYATNVNVGKLLSPTLFADSRPYQTREALWWLAGTSNAVNEPASYTNVAQSQCNDATAAGLATSNDNVSSDHTTMVTTSVTYKVTGWKSDNNGTCYGTKTTTTTNYTETLTPQTRFSRWHYAQLPVNVSLLKNGSGWNSSFQWPVGSKGTAKPIRWDGCIEERATVSQASYSPIPAAARDLDLDGPVTSDPKTQWGMVLPDLIFTRNGTNVGNFTLAEQKTETEYGNGAYYACPTEAKIMQSWPDPVPFDQYVDSLKAEGNTYHDIGLLWGWRFLSPKGIFASQNQYTPLGGKIARHLIFMTDGDPCTGVTNYTAYGVAWFDRRQTDPTVAPTDGCTTTGTLTAQVNARTVALCTAIKNDDPDTTLWVITFGYVDPTTVTRLTNCASPGRYYSASNAATLQQTFATIANSISQLRLTN
jgi:Flp pilus assembly protein TadG